MSCSKTHIPVSCCCSSHSVLAAVPESVTDIQYEEVRSHNRRYRLEDYPCTVMRTHTNVKLMCKVLCQLSSCCVRSDRQGMCTASKPARQAYLYGTLETFSMLFSIRCCIGSFSSLALPAVSQQCSIELAHRCINPACCGSSLHQPSLLWLQSASAAAMALGYSRCCMISLALAHMAVASGSTQLLHMRLVVAAASAFCRVLLSQRRSNHSENPAMVQT
jgi:hypothetical protein